MVCGRLTAMSKRLEAPQQSCWAEMQTHVIARAHRFWKHKRGFCGKAIAHSQQRWALRECEHGNSLHNTALSLDIAENAKDVIMKMAFGFYTLQQHTSTWRIFRERVCNRLDDFYQWWRNLFQSGGRVQAVAELKIAQVHTKKVIENFCSLNCQLWRHKHWNITSLTCVCLNNSMQCFLSPQRPLSTLHPGKPEQGDQIVHGVFCQTFTNFCQIHFKSANNILQTILPKSCQFFSIKQFTLTMDPLLIAFLKLI